MIRTVLQRLRDDATVIHECRNCGTTLSGAEEQCPECGSDEVVTYEIGEA
ncbi:MAG: hypothetical protein V5A46_05650 [Haloferacaceae archaeon]